jgi:hypothetical protein
MHNGLEAEPDLRRALSSQPMSANQATYQRPAAKFCGIALGFALSVAAACGGSAPASVPVVPSGQAGAASATAGAPARAGSGATAGVNVLVAAAQSPSVACGATQCRAPKNVAADLLRGVTGLSMTGAETVGCCLDEASSTCSSAPSAGVACDVVAVPEPRCPGVDLAALVALVGGLGPNAQTMLGCCTHGMCGQDGALFGRGCVENGEAKRMLGAIPVVGPLIKVPDAMPCPAAASGDADAGV